MPLANGTTKRLNLYQLIADTMHMNEKKSFFYKNEYSQSYDLFESTILNEFNGIGDLSKDMESNKDKIAAMIMSILKKFHMYWNSLRFNNKFDKLKIDTKEILRTLMKTFTSRRSFLDLSYQTLINSLLQYYYRFIRAHKISTLIKDKGPTLIANQILTRYKAIANLIADGGFSSVSFVKEISLLMRILQSHHVLSFQMKLSQQQIMTSVDNDIIAPIKKIYLTLCDSSDKLKLPQNKRNFRDFTVVLILKFKQIGFIMFQYVGIGKYLNMQVPSQSKSPFIIKIYYELLDNLLILPRKCAESLYLKNCVLDETASTLNFVVDKYKVKRSTFGWVFLPKLTEMVKGLYCKADDQTWESWITFKHYYYENLLSVLFNYKNLYKINEMQKVTELESRIGNLISTSKSINQVKPINFGLLDILDKEIYDEFLSIKNDFNDYYPIEKSSLLLSFLKTRIYSFFDNFETEHSDDFNEDLKDVISSIKTEFDKWTDDISMRNQIEASDIDSPKSESSILNRNLQLKLQPPINQYA
jgi:hypothetical protein